MPRNAWEIPINADTSREDLERCILEAAHTSDSNVLRAAAKAQAELARREREEWAARFDAQESARVKAQQFQEAQITRQIEAQKFLMGQQLKVAKEQAEGSIGAAQAAQQSALATVALAVLTAILAVIAAITLFSV